MTTHATEHETKSSRGKENRWVARFEDLLQVKNVGQLKHELVRLAGDIQTEIQKFDINSHLSPEARKRLKGLETKYAEVLRALHKAQKQFDKEFSRSISVLKKTRDDAEVQINKIRARITKHQGTIIKASETLTKKLKATAKKTTKKVKAKRTSRSK